MSKSAKTKRITVDHEMKYGVSKHLVKTPDGIHVWTTYIPGIGTSVHIYEDIDANPVVSYHGPRHGAE